MSREKGLFVTLYGINNLGKTTQRELLIKRLSAEGYPCLGYKYVRYDISPSGPMLNSYLRNGNPHNLSPREFQTIQAFNKAQVGPILSSYLARGDVVVVEDYTWTSIAWGVGAGVDEAYLRELNSNFVKEDVAILLDGERFVSGLEHGHAHEGNNTLTARVREIHLGLAQELGWHIAQANRTKEEVHEEIWTIVKGKL